MFRVSCPIFTKMVFFKSLAGFVIILLPTTVVSDTCRNSFMQTCVNCIPSSVCGTISGSRLTGQEAECLYWCLMAKTSCKMATFKNGNCMMYAQSQCDSVEEKAGRTVYRKTCTADCVEYEISSQNHHRGTCESIIEAGSTNHTLLSCQSLCLDTYGCRGSTFWTETGICDLHECDSVIKSNDTHFTGRTCLDSAQFILKITTSSQLTAMTPRYRVSEPTTTFISTLTSVETTEMSCHNNKGFFAHPSNIAAVALVAVIVISAILATVACFVIKHKTSDHTSHSSLPS